VKQQRGAVVGRQLALLPFLLLALVPIYIMIVSAFKTNADIQSNPLGIPFDRLTLDNVVSALTDPQLYII
jgi:raffinose/stachyose/melibiose transport system permease protein